MLGLGSNDSHRSRAAGCSTEASIVCRRSSASCCFSCCRGNAIAGRRLMLHLSEGAQVHECSLYATGVYLLLLLFLGHRHALQHN